MPQVEVKDNWRIDYESSEDYANLPWWNSFDDPVLNRLIKEALINNNDLKLASSIIKEVSGMYGYTHGDKYPQIFLQGGAEKYQRSIEQPIAASQVLNRVNNAYELDLNISWELDIWGRLDKADQAAMADLLASEEGRRGVIMSLVASVASDYVTLLFWDSELDIAKQTKQDRKEAVELFEIKIKGGQVSELELAQVRATYQQISSQIPIIEREILVIENRLSILLGRNPGPIERGRTLEGLPIPYVPKTLPADLLTRRPDIRFKAQQLMAANARVGMAEVDHLPRFSLVGILGYSADHASNLFLGSAGLYSLALKPVLPIFTAGKIDSNIERFEGKESQAVYEYQSTVLKALKEVDDNLISLEKLEELYEIEKQHLDVLDEYIKHAHARYEAGFEPYMTVLDAERNMFTARSEHAKTQRNIYVTLIGLYKAMGGGWIEEAEKLISTKDDNA